MSKQFALDAGFAAAYSGLAMALVSQVLTGIMSAHTAMPMARAAATRALNIDTALQDADAVLGMVSALYDLEWQQAERHFRLAVAREPVSPYVRWYYSFSYLLPMGQARQSVQECMRGMEDDPLNFIGGFHYAGALLAGGKTEAGEAYLRQLAELHVSLYQPYYLLALSQASQGMQKEALTAAKTAYFLAPWSTTTKGLLAGLLRCAGDADHANQLHHELLSGEQHGAAMGLSLFYVGCGEMDQAAEWLERAVEQRDTRTILLIGLMRASRPHLFRSDFKWLAILRALGIPQQVLDK
jgi:tetratricopeptide (TPR) repeat protein